MEKSKKTLKMIGICIIGLVIVVAVNMLKKPEDPFKNPKDVDIRFAFCFPDVYEVGMSHLGTRILYHTINLREDTYCERTFAPWPDMEELMRKNNIPLYTLETKDSLDKFDLLGFTLIY